jgi:transcriptional regulator with XRE-family HTH domain
MNDIELIKFGQKIKFERIKRNWSQEQLAEISNISIHGISNIETGKTDVKYSNILRLAKAFDMRACDLLDFNL